jgi:signal transduction histidine kinase
MLEISAIESGKLRLHRKPTDIHSLIEQNLSLNRPLAERRQIGISVIANGALPLISIDSHKIYQVIDNLVTNAIKFSSPGKKIEIRIHAEREFAMIDVQDQGPGIPANERRAVFKLFQTARGRDTSSGAGTGLGLAIAKSIVEAHGGRLMLDSRMGKGSTFTVTLPVAAHDQAIMTHRGSRASRSVRKVASATG